MGILPRARLWLFLAANFILAAGLTADIPGIYGPVLSLPRHGVDVTHYFKASPSDFKHPGLWHTHEELETIRHNVKAGKQPWASTFANFSADDYSQAGYQMKGPEAYISRGHISNYSDFTSDVRAAWQNALMWYITRDQAHWNRSTTILDAWGSNLTDVVGIDRSLLIGLEGDMFANAAEIMRWEGGWVEQGASFSGGSGFSNQLYWLFSRQSVVVGQANYGMVSIKALLTFAVYLNDVTLYNYAINEFVNNPCAGLPALYQAKTGQSSESGRDQAHAQTSIGWTATAARVAQSQGGDLYSLNDNLLLKGSEYSARYNLNESVPYDPSYSRCEDVLVNGPWPTIAEENRGLIEGVYGLIYYEYHVKRGLPAPWTTKAQAKAVSEHSDSDDHPSWDNLIWAH